MNDRKEKSRVPILAAGGIVLRNHHDLIPQFAVVQSRKLGTWGLPKGKLVAGEDAITAAHREALEETGHHVTVHEFLGTLVYETSRRPKVVQFWRMEAAAVLAGDLMPDVTAVDWLALEDAINRLSHVRERLFLEQVGPIALKLAQRPAAIALYPRDDADRILVPGVPLAPVDDATLSHEDVAVARRAGSPSCGLDFTACQGPAADVAALASLTGQARATEDAGVKAARQIEPHAPHKSPGEKSVARRGLWERSLSKLSLGGLMKKTWGWFRHAALMHRQHLD